ncbi:response regulator transcription factor [bacterium]|nr:response regulator transcription factor [bacterium]
MIKSRVLIVADTLFKARALATRLEQHGACEVVGHVTDLASCLLQARTLAPEVVVFDPDSALLRNANARTLILRQHPTLTLQIGVEGPRP